MSSVTRESAFVATNATTASNVPANSISDLYPRTPEHHRILSPPTKFSTRSPSPDSPTHDLAKLCVGERSLTPYPPRAYGSRVLLNGRSVTPYPHPTRGGRSGAASPASSVASLDEEENEPFERSAALSSSPKKCKKENKAGEDDAMGRGRERAGSVNSVYTFGVPMNSTSSPSRSSSRSSDSCIPTKDEELLTPPMVMHHLLVNMLLEVECAREVERRCKEITESSLKDVTEAFGYSDIGGDEDRFEWLENEGLDEAGGVEGLCPPNTPCCNDDD